MANYSLVPSALQLTGALVRHRKIFVGRLTLHFLTP